MDAISDQATSRKCGDYRKSQGQAYPSSPYQLFKIQDAMLGSYWDNHYIKTHVTQLDKSISNQILGLIA